MRGRRHAMLVLLGAVLMFAATGATACFRAREYTATGAPETLPQQVSRLLTADDVAEALTLAAQAVGHDRAEVARTLVQWASAQGPIKKAEAELLANVYLVAAALDPLRNDVYPPLVALVADFRLSAPARQGAAFWFEASGKDPARDANPDFAAGVALNRLANLHEAIDAADRNPKDVAANVEAARQCLFNEEPEEAGLYAERARALGPNQPEVLSILADLGSLEPVSAEAMVDIALPAPTIYLTQVRSGKAVLTGYVEDVSVTYVIALPDGDLVARIEKAEDASLSPSGQHLAYGTPSDLGEPCKVFLFDLQSQKTSVLLDTSGTIKGIAWSPDGAYVAVSCGEGLVVAGAGGADRRVVMPSTRTGDVVSWTTWAYPHWLAGGKRVSAQRLGWEWIGEVQVYDLETLEITVALHTTAGQYEAGAVHWSPGEDKMAFCYRGNESWEFWSTAVAGVGGDAASPTIAVAGRIDVEPMFWSPDGKELLVRIGSHHWLWDAGTGTLKLLPGEPGVFAVLGDDGVIYFTSDDGKRLVGIRPAGWR